MSGRSCSRVARRLTGLGLGLGVTLAAHVGRARNSSFEDEYLTRHGLKPRSRPLGRYLLWACRALPLGLVAARVLFGGTEWSVRTAR